MKTTKALSDRPSVTRKRADSTLNGALTKIGAEDKEDEKETTAVLYRCLARLRASGELSRNRAGLTITTPSPEPHEATIPEVDDQWFEVRDEEETRSHDRHLDMGRVRPARKLLDQMFPPESKSPPSKFKSCKSAVANSQSERQAQKLQDDNSAPNHNDGN